MFLLCGGCTGQIKDDTGLCSACRGSLTQKLESVNEQLAAACGALLAEQRAHDATKLQARKKDEHIEKYKAVLQKVYGGLDEFFADEIMKRAIPPELADAWWQTMERVKAHCAGIEKHVCEKEYYSERDGEYFKCGRPMPCQEHKS